MKISGEGTKRPRITSDQVEAANLESAFKREVAQSDQWVSRDSWSGKWPLTVDRVQLDCIEFAKVGDWRILAAIAMDEQGREWQLNGTASSRGYRDLKPIWALDREQMSQLRTDIQLRVNIRAMLERALALCD